jgi:hypothetical protein
MMKPAAKVDPLDYEADARDRIWRLLEIRNIAWRDRLKQSVDSAGAQLEYAKPSLLGGWNRDGSFYAGPAVTAPSGTVLIVLAHHEKVFTTHIRSGAEHTFTECVVEAIDYAREVLGEDCDKCSGDALGSVIETLIKEYGRAPGHDGTEVSNEHNVRIIGMLFIPMPETARAELFSTFERLIARAFVRL